MTRLLAAALLVAGLPACAALEGAHTVVLGGADPITISALARRQTFDASYLSFFPSMLHLRPGDAIRFEERGDGGPHTVTLGRAVDRVASAVAAAPDGADVGGLPEMQALPLPFGRPRPGEAPAFHSEGARRCVVVQRGGRCEPRSRLPEFDGKVDLFNSGIIEDGERFTVRLSDDIAPGRYAFMCLLYPEAMRGEVEIVEEGGDRPHPGTVRERGEDDLEVAARALSGAAQAAAAATAPGAAAGVGEEGTADHLLTFGPDEYRVPAGRPLTWRIFGLHSVTFSPAPGAERGPTTVVEGNPRLNDEAWKPVPTPTLTSQAQADGTSLTVLDGGTWDGTGTRSSGIVRSFPPSLAAYTLTFSRPGRYEYRCLVHAVMQGRVVVEPGAGS